MRVLGVLLVVGVLALGVAQAASLPVTLFEDDAVQEYGAAGTLDANSRIRAPSVGVSITMLGAATASR